MGMPAPCTQCCACPLPTLLRHHCALLSAGLRCQEFVQNGSNKVPFWGVNEEQLTLFRFPEEASTRQKLIVLLFLVDLFCMELFTS